ncbi:MAG: hypothetical protein H0U52_09950 [Chloroflexi bacterium]|nr:hypothetical protein [Chloroflexota bacterium]
MLRALRSAGITPDMFYFASLGSILLSLVLWFLPRSGDDAEKARPERLAIFVGLWPPTLFLMGHALRAEAPTDTAIELPGPSI